MEGAHKQQRQLTDMLVGDNVERPPRRDGVRSMVQLQLVGAARASRQHVRSTRARNGMPDMKVLAEDAEAAMKAGNALVQASVEHLEEAERSWDKYVKESGSKIRGFPTKMAAGGGGAGSHERQRSEQLLLQRWRVSGSGRNARS